MLDFIGILLWISLKRLGAFNIYTQGYFSKVSGTLSYAVQHITPQDIEAPEGGGHYEKESLSFLGLVNVYGSIVSVFAIGTYYIDSSIKNNKKAVKNNKIKQAS